MTATIIPFPGKFRPTATACTQPARAVMATDGDLLAPCTCLALGVTCPVCARWTLKYATVRQSMAQRQRRGD
jgi:hypothetical protein